MLLTPLRYPGGKAQYIPIVESRANLCPHSRYVEPFAGGAAIALHFAIRRHTPAVINDMDPAIYAFWHSVLNHTDEFIERIKRTPVNMEEWRRHRETLFGERSQVGIDLGFAAFFLNRCNFSGCLRANPIGGLHQSGKWRMNVRFNKEDLIRRVRTIAEYRSLIQVSQLDAVDLVGEVNKFDFLYLDPPYYSQGKQLYANYLTQDGHQKLAQELANTPAAWLMSYDKHPYIESLYQDNLACEESVRYSFLRKVKAKELLISSHP